MTDHRTDVIEFTCIQTDRRTDKVKSSPVLTDLRTDAVDSFSLSSLRRSVVVLKCIVVDRRRLERREAMMGTEGSTKEARRMKQEVGGSS